MAILKTAAGANRRLYEHGLAKTGGGRAGIGRRRRLGLLLVLIGAAVFSSRTVVDAQSLTPPSQLRVLGDAEQPPELSVSVAPATVTLSPGQTQQFTAMVTGTTTLNVSWSASGGTIGPNGVYTARAAPGTFLVTATQSGITASASVTIVEAPQVTVNVSPATVTLLPGQTQQFTATVTGTTNQTVSWSATGGTIGPNGVYTAGAAPGTFLVTATQSGITASASVTIVEAPQVTVNVSPATVTLLPGQTQQFTATVTGTTNQTVSWSATGGTITQTGFYTAGGTSGIFLVSAIQGGVSGTATVTIAVAESSPFAGTTIYVSTSGSDTNPGTQSSPVRTIQRGVNLANAEHAKGIAARVLIASGIYREAVDLGSQKTEALFVVEGAGPSTVLTGADIWTAWTPQPDGSLTHHWPYKWGMKALPNGWDGYWNWDGNGHKRDILRRAEMVYVNGLPLRGVLSLNELAAGTFFVNESTERLHVRLPAGLALAQATIEVGIRQMLLRINARRNVTLRNFAAMKNRAALTEVTVHIANSRNITVEHLHVQWNAYGGLASTNSDGVRVRHSVFSDNGVRGLGGYRDRNYLLEDSEIARNNWRGQPAMHTGWDTVFKWGGYRDAVARRVRIVDNRGNGFWIDHDNQRITLRDSLIAGNGGPGWGYAVYLEKNQGPVLIENNRICNNGNAGLGDAQTDYVTLRGNQIFGNAQTNILFTGDYRGRNIADYETGKVTLVRSHYWTITDNLIVGHGSGTAGWLWAYTDHNAPGAWAELRKSIVQMDRNQWFHSGRTGAFRLPQGAVTYSTFRSDVQLANPAHEAKSAWQVPPALSCTMP